ncbi:MAG TPA: hypothetical protein VFO10_26950 [Oligoflexus sp.]|uniref:hypothetical protein n=1 Tax=Oligoflexus sp. TaxID=1971216 RepID=UPI002D804B3D|nr:hypothetical protein [Oligoflexus sp.]HET9240933.1 hypothetical protein [Oligoflexus sp.]
MRSLFSCLLLTALLFSLRLNATEKKLYQLDVTPLQAEPELARDFQALQEKFQVEALTNAEHEKRLAILEKVVRKKPDWLDGYSLMAAEAFFLGSSFTDPKDHPTARRYLEDGEKKINECLKQAPSNILCKFFKASLRAKIASIDGIFASLRYGQSVRDAWLEVVDSKLDMQFRPNVSLQGSVHYGLGLFFRLVPNFFLMDWIFHIRGNIDESIRYHRAAMKFDGDNPCYTLMLAVSLLCKVKGKSNTPEYTEAMSLLNAPMPKPIDVAQAVCVHDVPKIRNEPKKTCGYTQAKYQDDVKEEDLK